jgi:hypothetical protein
VKQPVVKLPSVKLPRSLAEKYPPSAPCACPVCVSYCRRPGWWTVAEAARAIDEGYAGRMMLEMPPGQGFGVLSPAFNGNELDFARSRYAERGCTFLHGERCELHGRGLQPLECRFCHHTRPGQGPLCHADLAMDWNTPVGQSLVLRWSRLTGFLRRLPGLHSR